ncbi:Pde1c [Acrasis kona]|uniref:Pde1c n=1 Tax=Acrasis kona TaxID=1008807 RepID=A0AAW2Z7H4_9EUKA
MLSRQASLLTRTKFNKILFANKRSYTVPQNNNHKEQEDSDAKIKLEEGDQSKQTDQKETVSMPETMSIDGVEYLKKTNESGRSELLLDKQGRPINLFTFLTNNVATRGDPSLKLDERDPEEVARLLELGRKNAKKALLIATSINLGLALCIFLLVRFGFGIDTMDKFHAALRSIKGSPEPEPRDEDESKRPYLFSNLFERTPEPEQRKEQEQEAIDFSKN